MKRDATYFDGVEPDLIYVAKRLKDATNLERTLEAAGIDYGVETDEYPAGVIFRRMRVGAFFYIRPETRSAAEAAMLAARLWPLPPETPDLPAGRPA